MTDHRLDTKDEDMKPDDAAAPATARGTASTQSFWRSRTGISLIIALTVGAALLSFEHRIHIFAGSGLLVFLLLGCGVMHLFMHGGGKGHGGGDKS